MADILSTVDLLHAYVERLEARDWAGFADLLHEDVVYRLPQTGEVVRGRDAYLAWTRTTPRAGISSSRRPTATTLAALPGSTLWLGASP
jgi:ketosteroid isomerase-like protein